MSFKKPRRAATVIAGLLLGGLAAITALGPLAGVASAAISPTITVPSFNNGSVPVNGSGFTPGGQVHVEQDTPWGVVVATKNVVASKPHTDLVCGYGVHPVCKWVTFPGGQIATLLTLTWPGGGCGSADPYTIKATDLSTGAVASEPTTVLYMC